MSPRLRNFRVGKIGRLSPRDSQLPRGLCPQPQVSPGCFWAAPEGHQKPLEMQSEMCRPVRSPWLCGCFAYAYGASRLFWADFITLFVAAAAADCTCFQLHSWGENVYRDGTSSRECKESKIRRLGGQFPCLDRVRTAGGCSTRDPWHSAPGAITLWTPHPIPIPLWNLPGGGKEQKRALWRPFRE